MMNQDTFLKYYASTPNFRICNPNPDWKDKKGMRWDRADCVIRALANSIECTWIEAYDFLSAKARRDFNVPNDGWGFRRWVVENGATWTHCKAVKGKKRMTCLEFAKSHKEGNYILSVANHEVACVNGVLLDAFNPSEKCVVGYYDMTNFKLE